jgi:predicted aminopeptidase
VKGLRIAGVLLATLVLPACSAPYLVHLGIGQSRIMLARRDYREVLRDPGVSAREKSLILLVQEAKRYGETEIGLARTPNFESYVQLDRTAVSWIVSAAERTRLEPHDWWFPIVGSVPYKGYFSKAAAEEEARGLAGKGLDTSVDDVAAYSTLGYFADPLFSTFARYPESAIPNLILHELTHATIFIKGEVDFDEGLATFIGNKAGVAFLEHRFGPQDARVAEARRRIADDVAFGAFIEALSERLEALYARKLPEARTLTEREAIFAEEKRRLVKLFRNNPSNRSYDEFIRSKWNNAVILANRRYYGDLPAFEKLYASRGGNLRRVLAFFREVEKRGEDPKLALRREAERIARAATPEES